MPTVPQFSPSVDCQVLASPPCVSHVEPSSQLSPSPFTAQREGPDNIFIPGSGSSYPCGLVEGNGKG